MTENGSPKIAFVTGATGLLGNNLVRELLSRGYHVRALVRSPEKAAHQLPAVSGMTLVQGDMENVAGFTAHLKGADVVFHTAAYFRDSLTGGNHWKTLERINVKGTSELIEATYAAGTHRFLHVSSIGALIDHTADGRAVDETMRRKPDSTKNDYYKSKVLADREVDDALKRHPEMWAAFVMPGFMHGPGDAGPTAAVQTIYDFIKGALPGVIDAHFSYVDARDVAFACVEAAEKGQRGRFYLAAGRRFRMQDIFAILERLTGKPAPTRKIPTRLLSVLAIFNEVWARISGKPVLLSWSIYRTIRDEGRHAKFDSSRAEKELGVQFRPIETTLRDTLAWIRQNDMAKRAPVL
ncbi:MAG: SDR family oxidoreductase [Parvibaculaceae bacterium]